MFTFISYLYYRLVKKEKLIQESKLHFYDIMNAFTKDKLLFIATCLVMISQFLPFNRMSTVLLPTPAFANHPIISSGICIIAFLILVSISQENEKNIDIYIIIEYDKK